MMFALFAKVLGLLPHVRATARGVQSDSGHDASTAQLRATIYGDDTLRSGEEWTSARALRVGDRILLSPLIAFLGGERQAAETLGTSRDYAEVWDVESGEQILVDYASGSVPLPPDCPIIRVAEPGRDAEIASEITDEDLRRLTKELSDATPYTVAEAVKATRVGLDLYCDEPANAPVLQHFAQRGELAARDEALTELAALRQRDPDCRILVKLEQYVQSIPNPDTR